MPDRDAVQQIIVTFGQTIGIGDLGLDDDGYCCLVIDPDMVINIELRNVMSKSMPTPGRCRGVAKLRCFPASRHNRRPRRRRNGAGLRSAHRQGRPTLRWRGGSWRVAATACPWGRGVAVSYDSMRTTVACSVTLCGPFHSWRPSKCCAFTAGGGRRTPPSTQG